MNRHLIAALAAALSLNVCALAHAEDLELAAVSSRASDTADALQPEEVRAWLASYQEAWDTRDVQALTALGVIRADQQLRLRDVLSAYKTYLIQVENESIRLDGDHAVLSFDRIDRDETGKRLEHPRQVHELKRNPDGTLVITSPDRLSMR